jgi:hypothetical protein
MAAVVDIRDDAPATAGASGLVVRATPHRSSTYLDVAADDGIHTLRIDRLPDVDAAQDAAAGMRRVTSLRIDRWGDRVVCVLRGLGHRHPLERPIGVGAALGLVRLGVPTVAVDHTVAEGGAV